MTDFRAEFIKARRAVIEREFMHLNPEQRKGVLATEGPLLLLAGAGSGKTTVMINRVANLIRFGKASDSEEVSESVTKDDLDFLKGYIQNPAAGERQRAVSLCALDPVAPWRIIAITFTNKAANELKERLERMLGPDAYDVWSMTFHSACCRILRRDIERLGFERSFTIYDTADSQRIMKEILEDMNVDIKQLTPRTALSYISNAKDQLITAEEFVEEAERDKNFRLIKIGKAYAAYTKRLKEANALDFDDLIYYTVRLLQTDKEAREYYQNKFKYVMIDEYQDTNNLQYLLASLLAGHHRNICVVGDDDQSIYAFRGATIKNIQDFESQYKDARIIRLEQNYRSTAQILEAANTVIRNNKGRKGKELWTNNPKGEPLTVYEAYNESDEANYAANIILDGMSGGEPLSSYALLYRMNAQSSALEYAFKRNGIPYRIIGGTRFFDRAEVKDMIAYLCVLNNRSDDLRLKRIINNPPRHIGAKTVETAEAIARERGKSLYTIISTAQAYPELKVASKHLTDFIVMLETLAAELKSMTLADFYEKMINDVGYVGMLEQKPTEENKTRLENVRELKSSILTYMENTEEPSLSGFLEETALFTDMDNYDRNADAVVMMTMHSAKGLEFPNVFIVGAEEGIFPSLREFTRGDELEEERRLCYVAMTRAKQRLYITRAARRMLFGKTSSNPESRFLREIPEHLVNNERGKGYISEDDFEFSDYGFSAASSNTGTKKAYGISDNQKTNAGAKTGYNRTAAPDIKKTAAKPKAPAAAVNFKIGETVEHKAFGKGIVVSVMPMGGDALLEVAFDDTGTKRLMAKAAAEYMKQMTNDK